MSGVDADLHITGSHVANQPVNQHSARPAGAASTASPASPGTGAAAAKPERRQTRGDAARTAGAGPALPPPLKRKRGRGAATADSSVADDDAAKVRS